MLQVCVQRTPAMPASQSNGKPTYSPFNKQSTVTYGKPVSSFVDDSSSARVQIDTADFMR